MVMASTAITATGPAAVPTPVLWLVIVARSIQMFSVKEIDYRATGEKENAD